MTPSQERWDTAAYQRLESVEYRDGAIHGQFADGTHVTVEAAAVLPERAQGRVDWTTLAFDAMEPYEFTVEADNGVVEIPAYRLRLLTDAEFNRHWDTVAERTTPRLGTRFRRLRLRKQWRSADLARQASITPRTMSRFELGQHDLGATKLETLLGIIGCSWKDLDEPENSARST